MFMLNIRTQLITFITFAVLVNHWNLTILLVLLPVILIVLIYLKNRHYFELSYRLKWFYIVMFTIFALNTPGEYVAGWPLVIKPTYEGVQAGLEQVLRIATILGLLSLVLTYNTKQQLISGIYLLMQPLTRFGVDIERFSARLWLTLHYVELQQTNLKKVSLKDGIAQYLNQASINLRHKDIEIRLESQQLNIIDYIALSIMSWLVLYSMY